MADDPHIDSVGRSGLTYSQWQDAATADFVAGTRDELPGYTDFLREFVADADGMLPPIEQIHNDVTGEWVRLPEPLAVHVDDLDRVRAEYQQRFLDEWNSGRSGERTLGDVSWIGPPNPELTEPRSYDFPIGSGNG